MAEPSTAVFDVPESFANNSSRFEEWDNLPFRANAPTFQVGREDQAQNADAFQYALMMPVEPHYAGHANWSSTEDTCPINTPPLVVDRPPQPPQPAVSVFGTSTAFPFPYPGQGRLHYVHGGTNFYSGADGYYDRQQINNVNMISGNGGLDQGRFGLPASYATATAKSTALDLSSANYQEGNIVPYGQQLAVYPSYAARHQPVASIQGNFNAQLPYENVPVGIYGEGHNAERGHTNTAASLGQYLAPIQTSTTQELSLSSHSATAENLTPPTVATGVASSTVPKMPEFFTCFKCERRYASGKLYHEHWLRVHVLKTTDVTGKGKRTSSIAAFDSTAMNKRQRMDSNADGVGTDEITVLAERRHSGFTDGKEQIQTATSGSVIQSQMAIEQSNIVLDLSVKPIAGEMVATDDNGRCCELTEFGDNQQGMQQDQSLVCVGNQSVHTKRNTKADCVTVRSAELALAFILPQGILPNQADAAHPNAEQSLKTNGDSCQLLSPVGQNVGAEDDTEQLLNCWKCPRVYRNRRSLAKHMLTHDESPGQKKRIRSVFEDVAAMEKLPHGCPLCPKRFAAERLLNQHLSFHRRAETP